MQTLQDSSLQKHISFKYTSFDRVVLRGYVQHLFVEGSVIKLLRNLGFSSHSNGVMRVLTDKFNSHIKKTANKLGVQMHWWGSKEKQKYHSKIDLIQDLYKDQLAKKIKKSKVIAIIRAVIKHWLEGNSIKCYNKNGCLLRVETTINKPDLPGLKLKKPAINLMAYYWYGLGSNSRYIETISDIDISILDESLKRKYQETITNHRGVKVAAPDLRKEHQVEFLDVLLNASKRSFGFRNKDLKKFLGKNWKTARIAYELRKLRERGAVKKMQASHYYQLTKEGFVWIFYSFFNSKHIVKPLLSGSYMKSSFLKTEQASNLELAYTNINKSVDLIMSQFKLTL